MIPNTLFALVLSMGIATVAQAATTLEKISPAVTPGKYLVTVMPVFNSEVAERLQKSVSRINGVEKVEAKTEDSTVHFVVKEGAQIKTEQIQKAVAEAS